MGNKLSNYQQFLYYYLFQKKIEKLFKGEKMKNDKKIEKGYIINPEWIKEWKRRRSYAYIKKKCLEKLKIEKEKLKNLINLKLDIFDKKDEKIFNSDENNTSIIKYSDFMIINEKILNKQILRNFVNEETFKSMKLNEKIPFEELKYIFKEEMLIFFIENYQIIKLLLLYKNKTCKVINITFVFFYKDPYDEFYKKFEKDSSEKIINYLKEINIFSEKKYSIHEDAFIVLNEEKMVESLVNCNSVIDKNNNKINFTLQNIVSFRGLENVGATCYMNSTLQCLANLKLITNNLLNEENYNFLIKNKEICRVTYEYTKVLIGLFCDESRTGYFRPMDFKKTISEFNPLFEGIKANDSKDLIIFLLEILNKEMVKIYNRKHKIVEDNQNEDVYQNIDTSNEQMVLMSFLNDFKKNYCSTIGDNLIGFNKSIFICQNCGGKTFNFNIFNNLIFSLEATSNYFNLSNNNSNIPIISFHHCFQYLSKEDIFNDTYCQKCKKVGMSIYKEIKYCMPNYLIIILNRGRGNVFNCHVQIPEIFDSSQYVELKNDNNVYELSGIVSHFGESSMEGHFIAFCKHNIDGKWRCYNDSIVTESNKDYLNKGTPYILFYKKMNIENNQIKDNKKENQENIVNQANLINQVNQSNLLNQINQVNQVNQVNQANQVNQVNQINQINQVNQMYNNMLNMNVNNQFNLNNNIYQGNMLPYNNCNNYNQLYNMNYQQNINNNFINNQNFNYFNNI